LYLALQDTGFNVGIKYHEDPNAALLSDKWYEWNIDLADANFAALDMHNIDKVYIGFGDRVYKPGGGKGVVYFDDIRIYRSRFVPGKFPPLPGNIHRDVAGLPDGVVDEKDLNVIAADWLLSDEIILTTEPDSLLLGAHYQFEYNANDSVSSYHGAVYGTPTYETGKIGSYAISLGADSNDYIIVQDHPGIEFTGESFSVALWVNSDYTANPKEFLVCNGTNNSEFTGATGKRYALKFDSGEFRFLIDDDVTKTNCNIASTDYAIDDWVHVTAVCDRDSNELRVYLDGLLDATTTDVATLDINSPAEPLYIGGKQQEDADANTPAEAPIDHFLRGQLDDVRIYTYALSDAEALYLALEGASQLYVPLVSPANIYDEEAEGLKWVNFRDFAVMANDWLKEEPYWP
jgi:hypothetical protein